MADSTEEEDYSEMEEEMDTEDELEQAMNTTSLYEYKKGLVRPLIPKKNFTNDLAGLRQRKTELEEKHNSWLERVDVTSTLPTIIKKAGGEGEGGKGNKKKEAEGGEEGVDPENDFSREMHFMRQAQASVLIGLKKLEEINILCTRPEDYFAEMVKTDDHMRKVREKLLMRHKRIEASEKAKKMRELRKYGKKVQEQVLDQRRREKKDMLQSVKKYSKGRGEKPEFLKRKDDSDEDEFPTSVDRSKQKGRGQFKRGPPGVRSKKRQAKDVKYGSKFGLGKKRDWKKNTPESSADMSTFKRNKPFGGGKGGGAKGGVKGGKGKAKNGRPGKSTRQRQKTSKGRNRR